MDTHILNDNRLLFVRNSNGSYTILACHPLTEKQMSELYTIPWLFDKAHRPISYWKRVFETTPVPVVNNMRA